MRDKTKGEFSLQSHWTSTQCRRQSIQSRGAKSKSRGPKSKIILIGITSSELLFPEHFCNYFE